MTTLTGEPQGVGARLRQSSGGLDWWLLGMALAVSGFGVFVVRAATESDVASNSGFYFTRQLAFTVVGLVCLFFVLRLNLDDLSRYVWTIYAILVASVGAVLVLGASARGSTRWIELGPVRVQPSELGKVVIAFVLAVVVVERLKAIDPARLSWMVLGLTMLPAVIVFLQPDLGTALCVRGNRRGHSLGGWAAHHALHRCRRGHRGGGGNDPLCASGGGAGRFASVSGGSTHVVR